MGALGLITILIMMVGVNGDYTRILLNWSANVRKQEIIHLNKEQILIA